MGCRQSERPRRPTEFLECCKNGRILIIRLDFQSLVCP